MTKHTLPPLRKELTKEQLARLEKRMQEKKVRTHKKINQPSSSPQPEETKKAEEKTAAPSKKRHWPFFWKGPKEKTEPPKANTEKSKKDEAHLSGTETKAEEILKKMQTRPLKAKRKKLQRKSLQEYLEKAGYNADAERLKRTMFRIVVCAFLVISAYVLLQASRWGASWIETLIFLAGLWAVVFWAGILLAVGAVYFFLDYRVYKRTQELEDVLPDFLQLASANIAAGMPIDRALWYSIRPNFGVLAKEMEEVAKATMSGEDLESSLVHFTKKYDSVLLKRSISILIEGLNSGGEMADLLNKIALNIDEIKIMKKEMAANVTTYAIFIIVAAVGIAPALFGLATQLLMIIVGITSSLDLNATSSFFTLSAVSPSIVGNFVTFSYVMLVVSSVFGACIVSIIKKGRVIDGIKTIPAYALVAVVVYKLSVLFLGGMFGSIV